MPDYETWTSLQVKPKAGTKPSEVADLGKIYLETTRGENDELRPGPLDDRLRLIGLNARLQADIIYFDATMVFPKQEKKIYSVPTLQLEAGNLVRLDVVIGG